MNGNGFNGFAMGQGYATGMGNTQPLQYVTPSAMQPLMTNPLTAEEQKLLETQQDTFDLKVQPKEVAEAVCTHKKDGRFHLTPLEPMTGECVCNLCKARFNPTEVTEMYVQDAVDKVLNVLQTCKMIGVDMNNEVIRQYFQIIPYITRLPKLYNMLVRIFEKYNMQNPVAQASGPNVFNMYNSIMNPAVPIGNPQMMDPYGGAGYYNMMQQNMVNGGAGMSPLYQQPQQPVMMQPYGAVYQQPVMNQPTFGQTPPQAPQMPNQQPPVQAQANAQQTNQQQPQQTTGQVHVKDQIQL